MARSRTKTTYTSRTKKRQTKAARAETSSRKILPWVFAGIFLAGLLYWYFSEQKVRPDFDGARALDYVERQVAFGPRVPGTEAHRQTRDFLVQTLSQFADQVGVQRFSYTDRHDSTKTYEGSNIIASFNVGPDYRRRIMLAAHWDTRPTADKDPVEANRLLPVPGANDGASGVAVLLELASLMKATRPGIGVDIVLFDLEDLGDELEEEADDTSAVRNPFSIGSEAFASANPDYRPSYGIVLDMVCDGRCTSHCGQGVAGGAQSWSERLPGRDRPGRNGRSHSLFTSRYSRDRRHPPAIPFLLAHDRRYAGQMQRAEP